MDNIDKASTVSSQTHSPLFALPGELRNEIYALAMTPSVPIVNPSWDTVVKPKHQQIPPLGTAILRTCRATYAEADSSVLLRGGDFVFTRVAHIEAFFSRLSMAQGRLVGNVTIDLREAASGDPTSQSEQGIAIANEWLHYLFCTHNAHPLGAWCSRLSTLSSDMPHLRNLCLDLTGWQPMFAGSRQCGWKYLQSLLRKLRGLDCFTLKGKCLDSRCWEKAPVPWGLGPWFSPAFGQDESALATLIGSVVREEQENEVKLFEWRTVDGITSLHVRICSERDGQLRTGRVCAEDGSMLWKDFVEFKDGRDMSIMGEKSMTTVREMETPRRLGVLA